MVFSLIFTVSAVWAAVLVYQGWKEERAFASLAAMMEQPVNSLPETKPSEPSQAETAPPVEDPENPGQTLPPEPVMLEKFKPLYEMNPEIYGWISIPGTDLNYPVMYTPAEPEYYLRRAFDGTSSRSGVPFVGEGYYDGCGHHIIYGHNMLNGTMFSTLQSYADPSFWQEHSTIRFDTLYAEGTYEVLAAFYSRVFYTYETDVFRYYNYTDLSEPAAFDDYVSNVMAMAAYDTGVTAEYGDELITLITCGYSFDTERFVVVARKK